MHALSQELFGQECNLTVEELMEQAERLFMATRPSRQRSIRIIAKQYATGSYTIDCDTPSLYQGTKFEGLSFTFKDGRIVEARGNPADRLRRILDSDEGARYVGEFAIGVNPFITEPMLDTLFDEKIAGSIHFTPGNAYDECDNGNKSSVHWDLVLIQTPEKGGGEIWFDDVLVRKDGLFVLDALQGLNPDQLK